MTRLNEVGRIATAVFIDEDGFTKVVYHRTVVAQWNKDIIMLDNGGWMTVTTKNRMNQASNQYALGYQVYQKDFEWFVDFPNGNQHAVPFENGMVIAR